MNHIDDVFTVAEVAKILRASESQVRDLCAGDDPRLPNFRIGVDGTRGIRILRGDLEAFMRGRSTGVESPERTRLEAVR